MDAPSASTLTRYRTAIAACASLAALSSIWYLLSIDRQSEESKSNLHRSNAVRRRHDARSPRSDDDNVAELLGVFQQSLNDPTLSTDGANAALFEDDARIAEQQRRGSEREPNVPMQADDEQTEHDVDEPPAVLTGQRLQKLAYHIAKSNHDRDGLIHHGVTCDECGQLPIRGPRYHCNNCPDFDVCESCEAKDNHLRTHVFSKIKIPAPWGGKDPQPVWYPGKPHKMPSTLDHPSLRNLRNELVQKSGFELNKIDGLYLQFTCIANVGHEIPSSIGYCIDRTSFNQCFIQQVMTEKASMPSLIKDRLFALFDADQDGLINFEEYVMGTAMIHGKQQKLRKERVFKALDLDDDGYISRKDCQLIFKSFYELNREILLGYLEVDRLAENAVLLQSGHDPREHVAGGRSLATYFNSGFSLERSAGRNGGEAKVEDPINGDLVLSAPDITTIRTDADLQDTVSPDGVAKGETFDIRWIFYDEVSRLGSGRDMRYLTDQVRFFQNSNPDLLRMHDDQLWVAHLDHPSDPMPFLKVEESDLEDELDWRDRLSDEDPGFSRRLHTKVIKRIKQIDLWFAMLAKGDEKILHREQRRQLSLEDYPGVPVPESTASGHGEQAELICREGTAVGGTAASHTVFLVVRDALDELLDDVFRRGERLEHEVRSTATERHTFRKEINDHILSLYQRRWVQCRMADKDPNFTVEGEITMPNWAAQDMKSAIQSGKSIGKRMVDAFIKTQVIQGKWADYATDNIGWHAVYWCMEIEAEVALETQASTSGQDRRDRRASTFDVKAKLPSSSESIIDPTMPQFKPNGSNEDVCKPRTAAALSKDRLHYLSIFEAVARRHGDDPSPAALDFETFEQLLERTDDGGNKLLGWMGGWVDLVNF